jgi:NAD(P)-dependent dehydrogenase (short-subunit alcohol dehydrogenase family)
MTAASKPVALVTGVSGGIGLATAKLFASKGWIVVGTMRSRRPTAQLGALPFDLQPAEMSRAADLAAVVERTVKTYGRLDAVVCNAGYGLLGPIDSYEYAQMRDQLAVNTLAPAELVRLAVPAMKKRGGGVVVLVSSVFGRVGVPWYSLYSASKFALEGLGEALSYELAPAGIRVKLVEPAAVNTAWWGSLRRGTVRKWHDSELTGRLGTEHLRSEHGMSPDKVAAGVFGAATDRRPRLRYPLGRTRLVTVAARLLPERLFRRLVVRALM